MFVNQHFLVVLQLFDQRCQIFQLLLLFAVLLLPWLHAAAAAPVAVLEPLAPDRHRHRHCRHRADAWLHAASGFVQGRQVGRAAAVVAADAAVY